jgi:hypothetical protein
MNNIIDLSVVLSSAPRECWLAINEDGTKIIAWRETIEDTVRKAKEAGVDEPLMYWSPNEAV